MKRIIYFIAIVCFNTSLVRSQGYVPMVVENAHWFIHVWDFDGSRHTNAFVIREDTIVNGVNFKKLNQQDLFPNNSDGPFEVLSEKLMGLIREDTLTKQVFYQRIEYYKWGGYCQDNTGELIYDFGTQVGDTIVNCGVIMNEDYPFTVDSIGYENRYGLNRKVLYTYEPGIDNPIEHLTEGIGYSRGLLGSGSNLFQTADHSVFMFDYCIGTDWDCGLLTSINELDLSSDISIAPNPVIDRLVVNNQSDKRIQKVQILSIDGSILLESSDVTNIDLSQLAQGVYLVHLQLEQGYYATSRVVKI